MTKQNDEPEAAMIEEEETTEKDLLDDLTAFLTRRKAEKRALKAANQRLRRWGLKVGRTEGRWCVVDSINWMSRSGPLTLEELRAWIDERKRKGPSHEGDPGPAGPDEGPRAV